MIVFSYCNSHELHQLKKALFPLQVCPAFGTLHNSAKIPMDDVLTIGGDIFSSSELL